MKKLILLIFSIFSIFNSINVFSMAPNNNNTKFSELPKEILTEIASKLIDIEKIQSIDELNLLKLEVKDLFEFARISKKHRDIVKNMFQKVIYLRRKKDLIDKTIKKKHPDFDWNNIDSKNFYNETALLLMADVGYKDIVELLIKKRANVNVTDNNGCSSLMYAAKNGYTEIVELLIQADADIDAKDKYGNTALKCAVAKGYQEIINLIKFKINRNNNNNN